MVHARPVLLEGPHGRDTGSEGGLSRPCPSGIRSHEQVRSHEDEEVRFQSRRGPGPLRVQERSDRCEREQARHHVHRRGLRSQGEP